MWPQLLNAGLQIGGALLKRGNKAQAQQANTKDIPAYSTYQSAYDKPAAGQIYDFYSNRAAGKNVGYSPEDLNSMNAQAIDSSTHTGNEYQRQAMAGRQNTGGMTTGGANLVREQSIGQTLANRSQAMRDISISNAVLKQNQIGEAASGLQNFLTGERGQQGQEFYDDYLGTKANNQNATGLNNANVAAKNQNTANKSNLIDQISGPAGTIGNALLQRLLPNLIS